MKRVNVNTPEELYQRWTNAVPRGMRTLILNSLIEMTCILVESIGHRILGLILEKKLHVITEDADVKHSKKI